MTRGQGFLTSNNILTCRLAVLLMQNGVKAKRSNSKNEFRIGRADLLLFSPFDTLIYKKKFPPIFLFYRCAFSPD